MKDTVIFVSSILGLIILGVVVAAVEISPDRLKVLETIIGGLLVILGASGRTVVPAINKRIMKRLMR